MILVVDNYDSFTYNLVQELSQFSDIIVRRNDCPDLGQLAEKAAGIVLSPGPGKPQDAGKMPNLIKKFRYTKPILGICLGHQGIGEAFGGTITHAKIIKHGKLSLFQQENSTCPLFEHLPTSFPVMRYHSLVIKRHSLPHELEVVGHSIDDHELMAIQHRHYPIYGVQFHPEALETKFGSQLLHNFVKIVNRQSQKEEGSQ